MIEALESRRYLSASAHFADGASAQLTSTGTLQVSAAAAGSRLQVSEDHGTVLVEDVGSGESASFSGVLHVKINGGRRNDALSYHGNSIGAAIGGAGGNDSIVLCDAGSASSQVDGGSGDDTIEVVFSPHAVVSAGTGDDLILLGTGAASGGYDFTFSDLTVDAGGGNDNIFVMAGHGTINGNSGMDTLHDLSGGAAAFGCKRIEVMLDS
jgi:hypothetical protein